MQSSIEETDLKIIGAGGFGTVYELPNGTVIKAIKDHNDCLSADVELKKQSSIYDAFQHLFRSNINDKIVQLVKNNIVISKPIESHSKSIEIDKVQYSCYFQMDKLYGIPLSVYRQFDNKLVEDKFDPEFLKAVGDNYNIMAQLSLNSELPANFYGVTYAAKKLGFKNPPRGFFITMYDQDFLDFIKSEYGFHLTLEEIKQIIGFIYGWIYFYANFYPRDIEITLGFNPKTNRFQINVLDFGMTENLTNNPKSIDSIIDDIGIDIYGDVSGDDPETYQGWKDAATIAEALTGKSRDLRGSGTSDNEYYNYKYLKYKMKYRSLRDFLNVY